MGSCISKCKPKKEFKDDYSNHVHDKLVIISQDPLISSIPQMTTMPLEKPLSPAPSSSFSCSSKSKFTVTPSSSSSSSSCSSSSTISTKDRSFSNEFLKPCVKDNYPHLVNAKNIEKIVANSNKVHSIREKTVIPIVPTPKKRARSNSPTQVIRQKSFRKEQNSSNSIANRGHRSSPSPSRRSNVENSKNVELNNINENYCRRSIVASKGSPNSSHCSSGVKRESFRAQTASPNRDYLMIKRNQVSKKIDGVINGGDISCGMEMDCVMEDVNNPLIALDCFIFL